MFDKESFWLSVASAASIALMIWLILSTGPQQPAVQAGEKKTQAAQKESL